MFGCLGVRYSDICLAQRAEKLILSKHQQREWRHSLPLDGGRHAGQKYIACYRYAADATRTRMRMQTRKMPLSMPGAHHTTRMCQPFAHCAWLQALLRSCVLCARANGPEEQFVLRIGREDRVCARPAI